MWAVVTYRKRGPLMVDGPYRTRRDARSVLRSCQAEEAAEPLGNQFRVVPVFRLVTDREMAAFMEKFGRSESKALDITCANTQTSGQHG